MRGHEGRPCRHALPPGTVVTPRLCQGWFASTAGTDVRLRTIFALFRPLWHAKASTAVDSQVHFSYIGWMSPPSGSALCIVHPILIAPGRRWADLASRAKTNI